MREDNEIAERVADVLNAFAFLREEDGSVGYLPEWRKRNPNRCFNIMI